MEPPRSPRDGLVARHRAAPEPSLSRPWVRAYRTATLPDDEVVDRPDGIRVDQPPRTVVDMTRYVDDTALASLIEARPRPAAVHDARRCERTAERLGTPGRPWVPRFLRVLAAPDTGCAGRVGVGAPTCSRR